MSDFCKHYTGMIGRDLVKIKVCEAGIEYDSVKVDNRYPCMSSEYRQGYCAAAEYPTPQEMEEERIDNQKFIREYFQAIRDGNCPVCNTPVKQVQVGQCVYGDPCGHRLYQGKARQTKG